METKIICGGGDWRGVDLRCSVEIKTPLVLYVEHQVSPVQELHNEEQVILFANNQRMEKWPMLLHHTWSSNVAAGDQAATFLLSWIFLYFIHP